jgi:hypothetical protein
VRPVTEEFEFPQMHPPEPLMYLCFGIASTVGGVLSLLGCECFASALVRTAFGHPLHLITAGAVPVETGAILAVAVGPLMWLFVVILFWEVFLGG